MEQRALCATVHDGYAAFLFRAWAGPMCGCCLTAVFKGFRHLLWGLHKLWAVFYAHFFVGSNPSMCPLLCVEPAYFGSGVRVRTLFCVLIVIDCSSTRAHADTRTLLWCSFWRALSVFYDPRSALAFGLRSTEGHQTSPDQCTISYHNNKDS